MSATAQATPPVSVVIPVHGDRGGLASTLDALAAQDYPGRVQVVVVDNGDNRGLPADGEDVVVVREPAPGSYAARNAGVVHAEGEVLAFTDADCRPAPSWLSRGVALLLAQPGAAFVGGRIEVFMPGDARPSGAGLWDLLHGLAQQTYVCRDGYAATANLLVRAEVLERVGAFDALLRSGGDREWGERASAAGVRAVYGEDVVVRHAARTTLAELQRKQLRVYRGWAQLAGGRGERMLTAAALRDHALPHTRSVLRATRRLSAGGYGVVDRARYVAAAHWLQYYSLVAWWRAATGASRRPPA